MIYGFEKIEPTFDYVLIRRANLPNVTPGGLHLPATSEENNHAIVIACGPGRENMPMPCKKGDNVIVAKFIGTKVMIDGLEHLMVKAYDIQAVLS